MSLLDVCIAKVVDYRNHIDSTVTVLIRFIVHLVGDMHCPGHVKYPWYKSFKFTLSGKEYGLHITSELDVGTCVEIRMPKIREGSYETK